MIRRMVLAISFVAALGVAGFAVTDSADAHGRGRYYGGHGRPYATYYGGGYGHYPHVYRSSYYPPTYYGPVYYGGYGGGHCHQPGGLSTSFGF
jgi:hypothetical protein